VTSKGISKILAINKKLLFTPVKIMAQSRTHVEQPIPGKMDGDCNLPDTGHLTDDSNSESELEIWEENLMEKYCDGYSSHHSAIESDIEVSEWYNQNQPETDQIKIPSTPADMKARKWLYKGERLLNKHFQFSHYDFITLNEIVSRDQYYDLIESNERSQNEKINNLVAIVRRENKELKFLDLIKQKQVFLYHRVTGQTHDHRREMLAIVEKDISYAIDWEFLPEKDLVGQVVTQYQYEDLCKPGIGPFQLPLTSFDRMTNLCRLSAINGDDSMQALCNLIWRVNPQVYNRLNLFSICSEPASEASNEGNIELLRYQLMKSDNERLESICQDIGLHISPWHLKKEELVPHCISETILNIIKKREPYHAGKQMSLIACQCQISHTSRRFLELLHTKITKKTDRRFSSKLKIILLSSQQSKFEPTYPRKSEARHPFAVAESTGFTFGGNKRQAPESSPESPCSKLNKFKYQKKVALFSENQDSHLTVSKSGLQSAQK
jgi:hypothetical protein